MSDDIRSGGSGFYSIIASWRYLLRTLILIGFVGALLFGLIYFLVDRVLSLLSSRTVTIATASGEKLEVGGPTRLLSFMIEPRGWSKNPVKVNEGDNVEISASGSINIAMGRMLEALTEEYKYKHENERDPVIRSRHIKDFSRDQKRKSLFAYPWNGPTGIDPSEVLDTSAREHIFKSNDDRVFPDKKAGQLVAAIYPIDDCLQGYVAARSNPSLTLPQVITFDQNFKRFTVEKKGYLCFIVNDEIYMNDKVLNTIAWQDNLGFFSVLMSIKSK